MLSVLEWVKLLTIAKYAGKCLRGLRQIITTWRTPQAIETRRLLSESVLCVLISLLAAAPLITLRRYCGLPNLPNWVLLLPVPIGWIVGFGLLKWRRKPMRVALWVLPLQIALSTSAAYSGTVLFPYPPRDLTCVDPGELVRRALAHTWPGAVRAHLEHIPPGTPGRADVEKYLETLLRIEREEAERKRVRGEEALKRTRAVTDHVTGDTKYYIPGSVRPAEGGDEISAFFYETDGETHGVTLHLRFLGPTASSIDRVILRADDRVHRIGFESGGCHRNLRGGGEWMAACDREMTDSDADMIRAIAKSMVAKLRYEWRGGSKDRDITVIEKENLRTVMDAYEAKGGRPLSNGIF